MLGVKSDGDDGEVGLGVRREGLGKGAEGKDGSGGGLEGLQRETNRNWVHSFHVETPGILEEASAWHCTPPWTRASSCVQSCSHACLDGSCVMSVRSKDRADGGFDPMLGFVRTLACMHDQAWT